jgi:DNA-binding transcriptional MocR family regulator
MLVSLDSEDSVPLTEQIVRGLARQVSEGGLRPGARLPSIREFASTHGVSRFTVVQAFDRLVAEGHLESRRGSGFYVARSRRAPSTVKSPVDIDRALDDLWLIRRSTEEHRMRFIPGCGWLPASWQDDDALNRGLRRLAKHGAQHFAAGYSAAGGYVPLREDIQRQLGDIGVEADVSQIITTGGAVAAIDLLFRYLIKPGDKVLVDDPGYFHTYGHLRTLGAQVAGVPWTHQGPDTKALAELAKEHRPKVFFTTATLHNPTGVTMSQACAYRLLRLAEEHDFLIVEDDVYGSLHGGNATRLATLDQLDRVVYVNGFSKTISPRLRVGYLAASPELIAPLSDLKLLTGMGVSEVSERLVHEVLLDGYYRKHLSQVREHLQRARDRTASKLEGLGLEFFIPPGEGLFLWVRHPELADSAPIAEAAARSDAMLAAGKSFRPNQEPSPWMRFNVAFSQEAALYDILSRIIDEATCQ